MAEIEFTSNITVKLIESAASDSMVVAAARVSTTGPSSEEWIDAPAEESGGLINFLMKNRHGTPFEHNMFTVLVDAPIAVFREWHRHRIGWSYNEESGRYKQLRPKFYMPPRHRPLVQVGKPGHYQFERGSDGQYNMMYSYIRQECTHAYNTYEKMLERGIAREVARGVLPVYIYSSMYATMNARSLMSFLSLRVKSDDSTFKSFPMWEIDQAAQQLEDFFAEKMPITHDLFVRNGRVAP